MVAVRFQINYALVIVGWHSFFLSVIYASLLGRNAATCILACDLVGDGFLVIELIPIKETLDSWVFQEQLILLYLLCVFVFKGELLPEVKIVFLSGNKWGR